MNRHPKIPLIFLILLLLPAVVKAETSLTRTIESGWHLVSFPMSLDGSNLCEVMPEATAVSVKGGKYEICGNETNVEIAAGHAYWVYSESAKRVLLKGVLRTSGSLTLNLEKGWNLIGPPSSYSIKWDDQIKIDGIELSKSTKIKGSLLKYDTATGTYAAATEMEPWTGYIVYANEACTVEFPAEATDEVTYKSFAATDVTTENGVAVVKKQLTLLRAEGVTDATFRTVIAAAGGTLVGYNPYLGVYQVEMPDGTDLKTAATTMKRTSAVAAATPNVVFGVTDYTPSDPPYAAGADAARSWGFVQIGAPKVWKIYTGTGTKVAVIDTGVDGTQTDLAGRVAAGADFIDAAGDAARDANGHGTHIAGIIAAAGDNGVGIAGVCWNCTVVPVRACDAQGNCPFYSVLNAIVYAVNNGASVINLSIAGAAQKDSDAWKIFQSVIDYAVSSDVVVVAAAGNSGADASGTIPAALDGVFAVGATDAADARASFSNYGTAVDLGAPGAGIYSIEPSGGTGYRDGTSAAAAFAAGAAAYVRSVQPGMAASAVTELLKSNADTLASGVGLGAGRLNLQKTLGAIATGNTAPVITAVNVGSSEIAQGGGTKVRVTASDADGDAIAYGLTADGGTLTVDGDNEWTWSAPDTRGEYQVTAAVSDGRGGTDTATASIEVDLQGLGMIHILPGVDYLYQGDIVQFEVRGEFDDGRSYPLHAVWEMGSPHGVVTADGKFTALAVGDALFSVRVGNNTRNFAIKILAAGEMPPSLNIAGFNNGGTLENTTKGQMLALGDIDGDSKVDAVVGMYGAASVWYKGTGSGTFTGPTTITALNCEIKDLNLADIDGDGDLDLGAACFNTYGYWILKNNGSGTFTLSQQLGYGSYSGTSINFADMTHHMLLDVIGGDGVAANYNHVFVNDGTGTFNTTAMSVGSGAGVVTNHIEPGDFNGDNYLDFAEANSTSLAVYLYNTSTEVFNLGSTVSANAFSSVMAGEVRSGGVSCGGTLDLIAINATTNQVQVFRGSGTGTFTSDVSLGTGPYYFISLGDIDNNIMPEIFAGTESGAYSSLFSIGTDSQACSVSYGTVGTNVVTNSWDGRFANLDSDRDLDLITAGPIVGNNDIWINNSATSNTVPNKPTAAQCTATATEFILTWSSGSDTETIYDGLLSYDVRIKDYSATNYMLSGVGQAGFGTYGFPQKSGAQYSIAYRYGTDIPQGHYKFNVRTVDGAYNRSAWYSQPDDIDCNHTPVVSDVGFVPTVLLNNGISEAVFTAKVVDYNGAADIVTNQVLMTGITGDTTPVTVYDDATHGDGVAGNYVYGTPIIGQTGAVKTPAGANYTGTYSYTVVDLSGATYTKNDSITIAKWPEPDVCGVNWPAFKCNEHHGSKSDNTLLFYPFMVQGSCAMASSASPIAFGGNEYIPGTNGYLYRCNLSTFGYSQANKLITSSTSIPINAPGAIVSSPSNIIFIASSDGKIYANNIDSTMSSYWSTPYSGFTGAISTPPIVQTSALTSTYDMVFAASEAGEVHAINKTTKAAVWTTTVSGAVKAAPAIKNGILYVADANGNVYGIDTITGNKMWTRSLTGKVPVSAVTTSIDHSEVYVTSTDGNLYALNVAAGTPIWQFTDPHSNTFADSPAYTASGSNDLLYVGDSGGYLYEIMWDGATKTTRELSVTGGSAINVPPAYMYGVLYVGAANGYLYAVGTSGPNMTVNSSKKICTTGGITGAMAVTSDGIFVYCSGDNKLYKVIQNPSTCPVVTDAGDNVPADPNTLRDCIEKANSDSTKVNIQFDPVNVLSQTIFLVDELPALTADNISIDGTAGIGVTIDGSSCSECNGFILKGNNQSIRNMNIINFNGTTCTQGTVTLAGCAGISIYPSLSSNTATIYGNYIGTDATDLSGNPNYYGIYVAGASGGIDIGYTDTNGTTYGNVISGNNYYGVVASENASNVKIKGNKIGTNVAGTSCTNSSSAKMGNKGGGIAVMTGATTNTVGVSSTNTGERNIISCNGQSGTSSTNTPGIMISNSAASTSVQGNYIGVCSNGSTACGNWGPGIRLYSAGTGNTIGNTGTARVNVISANKLEGIRIDNTSGVTIENARIGLPASGDYTSGLGNLYGIYISDSTSQSNNILSVTNAETRIAYNGNAGVYIAYGNKFNKVSNALLYGNNNSSEEPIHIPNNQITRPTITSATSSSVTVSTSCAGCTVDLYQVDDTSHSISQDATGYGEAPIYLGTATANGSGIATFTGITLTNGSYMTALVTDTSGSTSRYAANTLMSTDTCTGSTPTVSNTNNTGASSLRQCITYANSTAGAQTIKFSSSIANQTISVSSQLPDINDSTGATTIDGESNGITLSGASCSNCNGFVFKTAGAVKNMKIISFGSGAGIRIDGTSGVTIQNNTIGYGGANYYGIELINGANNNQIGGSRATEGNLISSNTAIGINIQGTTTTGNKIYGNTIGLNAAKTGSASNSTGIAIGSPGNQIGAGTTVGSDYGNVIAGNSNSGVQLSSATGNYIQGNIIGLKLEGGLGQPTGTQQPKGIFLINSGSNLIGGDKANGEGNTIGKNSQSGIILEYDSTDNNKIFGNYIGTDSGGVNNFGNGRYGILLDINSVEGNQIGHPTGSRGNVIAYNGWNGIYVYGSGSLSRNRISSNQIYKNGSAYMAIDLDDDMNMSTGHTPNDGYSDSDDGGNTILNYPTIASGTTTSVSGTIDSTNCASSACRVEVYAVDYASGSLTVTANSTGYGDMYSYVGYATASITSPHNWTANITLPSPSSSVTKVTAITIDGNGNTSEPSANFTLTTSGCPVTTNADSGTGSLRECINYVNSHAGEDITFSISNSTITLSSALPALNADGSDITATGKNIVLSCNSGAWNGLEIQSDMNVISGLSVVNCNQSGKAGIYLNGSSNTTLSGDIIGTDFTNATGKGNYYGVYIKSVSSIDIGTTLSGTTCTSMDNTISGNKESGIYVDQSGGGTSQDIAIYCNYIGLASGGAFLLPNGTNGTTGAAGIKLQGNVTMSAIRGNTIGGQASGTAQAGIYFAPNGASTGPSLNLVDYNYIGTNSSLNDLSNGYGVWIEASDGYNTFTQNSILFNDKDGVYINQNVSTNYGSEFTQNTIYSNLLTGINLNGSVNGSITPPQIVSVTANGSNYDFEVDLSGCPTTKCRLELFKAENTVTPVFADFPAGEGYAYVTNSGGYVAKTSNYTFSNVNAGSTARWFTVTTTDQNGNTSEFSVNAHIPETAPSDCDGTDWPKYHCNEVNAGVDTETLTKPFYSKWTQTAGGAIEGGAAVYNSVVYYGDSGGSFHARKASDGSIQTGSWPKTSVGAVKATPAAVDDSGTDLIIFGTANKYVYAVKADGTYKWSKLLPGASDAVESSPVVANGYAYVATNAGNVHALRLTDGTVDATYSSGTKISSGLVYVNGKIIFTSQDFSVYALDAESLGFLWKYTTGAALTSSPLVTNQKVYFGSADGKIYAMNENTGDVEWSTSVGEQVNSGPVITGGYLFIGSNSGKVYRVSATDGSGLQTYSTAGGAIVSSPVVAGTGSNTMIVFGSKDKYVYAIDTSGTLLWKSPTAAGGECNSSPAVAGSTIFIGCSDSKMYAYVNDPAPTVTINSPAASSWQKANFTVDVTNADVGSGLATCEWRVLSNSVETLAWTTYTCTTDPTATVGTTSYCRDQGTDKCEVFFRATDGNGTVSTIVSRKFSIDFTAPTAGTVTPANTATTTHVDSPYDLSTTFSDGTGSGVASCEYTVNGSTWAAGTWSSGTCSVTNLTCTNGTSLTLNMRATDTATNTGTATAVTRTCDTVAPTTTDNATTAWVNTDQTVTLTPTDTGSGMSGGSAGTWYCVDTAGTCTPTTSGTSVSVTCAAGSVCQKYVRYYSKDAVGNTESYKTVGPIKIDKSTPTAGTVTPANTATTTHVDSPYDLSTTFNDGTGSGISTCEYTVNGSTWTAGTWSSGTCSATNLTCTNGTSLTLNMRATDAAGNVGTATSVTRTCDTVAPTTTDNAPASWVNTDQTVTLTPTDTGSGMSGGSAGTWYCVDTAGTCTPTTSGTSVSVTCPAGSICTKYVRYYSKDAVGNTETIKSATVNIDKNVPTAGTVTPANTATTTHVDSPYDLSTTFSAGGGSAVVSCEYTVNGSTWTAATWTSGTNTCSVANLTCTNGASLTLNMRATNGAGNTGTATAVARTCDAAGPTAGTVTPANTATTTHVDSPYDVSTTFTDGTGSGVVSCEYTVNGSTWTAGTWASGSCSATNLTCTNGTSLTLNMRATDAVGNIGTATSVTRTCDTVVPTTTDNAPASWVNTDQTVTLTPTDTGAGMSGGSAGTWYCVDTAGTCTPTTSGTSVSVTCPAGSICTKYVRYYSKDAVGNTESVKTSTAINIDKTTITAGTVTPANTATTTHVDSPYDLSTTFNAGGGSAIVSCEYTVNGSTWTAATWTSGTNTCSVANLTCTNGASLTLNMRATNGAGNTGTATAVTRTCDTAGPTAGTVTPANTATATHVDSPYDVSTTFSDGTGAGVASCEYTVNGSTWTTGTWASGSCSATNLTCTNGTTLTLNMRATDAVGNTGTATSVTRTCDTVAPTTTDNAPASWVNSDQTVTLTPTDTGSGTSGGSSGTWYCVDTAGTCTPATSGTSVSVTCPVGSICTKYVRYYSKDAVGNTESVKTSTAINIDKTSITAGTVTPANTATTTHVDSPYDLSTTFSAGGGSAIVSCEYTVNGSTWTAATWTSGTNTCSVANLTCTNGASLTLNMRATNGAGNSGTAAAVTRTCDTAGPTAGTVTPANTATATHVDSPYDVSTTFADGTGSGVVSCEYTVNGSTWTAGTWSSGSCSATNLTCTNGTSLTLNMRATDAVGNTGTATSVTRTCDTIVPTTTDNAPASWVNSDQTVTLTPTDTGSGMSGGSAGTWYCVDTAGTCTPTTSGTSVSVTCASGSICTQYVRYYSKDAVGNTESTKTSPMIKIDKQLPVVTINGPAAGTWEKADFTVDVTNSDGAGGSGLSSCYYRVLSNSIPTLSWTTYTCSADPTITVGVAANCRDQGADMCQVEFYNVDNAGNVSSTATRTFGIDTTPPTVTINSPSASAWERADFTVDVTNTDAGGLISCEWRVLSNAVETLPWTAYTCTTDPTATVGSAAYCKNEGTDKCEVFFRATDTAGNVSTPVSRKFSIDWTPPTVMILGPSGWQSADFTLDVTNADTGGSGLSVCYYRVLSNSVVTLTWTSYTCSTDPMITVGVAANCRDQGPGMCSIEVYNTDMAGNTGSVPVPIILPIDWSSPVVNPVVFNPTWVNVDGSTTSTITATVTDAAGSTAISAVDADLSALNAGTITLYNDGTHGDTSASDNIYTNNAVAAGSGATCGNKTVAVTATDAVGQTGSGNGTILVNGAPQVASVTFSPNVVVPGGGSYTVFVKFTDCNGNSDVTSAVIDLSTVGVPGLTTLYNDGTHGDVTAGDDTFTGNGFTIPVGWTTGIYTALTATVTDVSGLTGTLNGTLTVSNVIPDPPVITNGIGSNGSIIITLTAPTTNTDGTTLTDLAQHNLYWSATPGGPYAFATQTANTVSGATVSMTHTDSFTWYSSYCYVSTAVTVSGMESAYSNEKCVVAIPPSYTFDDACAETDSNIYHPQSWPSYVNRPDDVAYDTATGHLFVADTDNNRINEFDPAIPCSHVATYGSYGSALGDLHAPTGIVRAPDGLLYIADYNDRVQVMDTGGNFLRQWTVTKAYSVAADDSGYIYVTTLGNKIYKFDNMGNVQGGWPVDANTPKGIDVDASGNIYYASTNLNQIVVLDSSGVQTGTIGSAGSGYGQFTKVQWVTVDRTNGLVYASDYTANRVSVFTLSGSLTNILGAAGSGAGYMRAPFGGTVLPDGRVYFSDFYNNRIAGFTMP